MASKTISRFIKSESSTGMLLLICVITSLAIANSPLGIHFERILHTSIGFQSSDIDLKFSVLNWINDGLMSIFFFLVGLEIKHELSDGHLSSFKTASVPVFAAIGGAIVPAIIFISINHGGDTARGWGIPMATDIAFALGVLSLLGKRVPPSLKVFLTTLAVVDDLLAIVVIALFYTSELHSVYLFSGLGIFLFLLMLNKLGVKRWPFYIIPGIAMWYCIHHSGIHATISGVLLAATIPSKSVSGSPVKKALDILVKPISFIIMPLFAIANSNIILESGAFQNVMSSLGLGIFIGLVVGKPIGIVLLSWITVRSKIGALSDGMKWTHITGIGLLAGIGFTMSIFISFLSFGDTVIDNEAKLSILIGSLLSGIIGIIYLKRVLQ